MHAVYFTDGSARPTNPGYSGSGVFGYLYKEVKKSRNYKHPFKTNLFFTENGIHPEKGLVELEVVSIIEIIKARNNASSTNNEAELLATILALEQAITVENIQSVTIFTDSNYIVTGYNENLVKWKANKWHRVDNKPIVHVKEWELIDSMASTLINRGAEFKLSWVKGHSDSYGNNVSDIYSVVASNASKWQFENTPGVFTEDIFNSVISFDSYKKSFTEKDFLYFFRDLYFSSNNLDDTSYCFLATSENPLMVGERNSDSIFVTNTGYVPPLINAIKTVYRSIPRNYITTCCIKLAKLENKDLFRLTNYIDIKYLITKFNNSPNNVFSLVGDTTPFILENRSDFPFIVNASKLFTKMSDLETNIVSNTSSDSLYVFDVTDKLICDNTFLLTNKDHDLDLSDVVNGTVQLKQKLIVTLGSDIPSYLAIKKIEKDICRILMILESNPDNNFCTLYFNIITDTRNIYTVNIENKYLRLISK